MRYLGGKNRLSKHISPILDDLITRHDGRFFEPFVGGFNIVPRMKNYNKAICSDFNKSLSTMYNAIKNGWEPPSVITLDDYNNVKLIKDDEDPITAFVSFGCSFGGKEWGGYARSKKGDESSLYSAVTKRSLKKKFESIDIDNVYFTSGSYENVAKNLSESYLIYCDPPYRGTTGYKTGVFDSIVFDKWCVEMCELGHTVVVSEFNVSRDWEVIWELERNIMVSHDSNERKTDKLFLVSL